MLRGVLPAWVEPDPLRSRATDALGLQEVADRIANRLLPGLSVLTTRARYFSFLVWARRETGNDHDERAIHRCELALVLAEARLSDEEPEHAESCRFVGSRNIRDLPRDRPPVDPRQVYKVPAWRAYRASMVALGLLEGAPRFALTDCGLAVARSFGAAVRARFTATKPLPARACLSEISPGERRQLRDLLGLSMRGRLDPEATEDRARRAAFAREVRTFFRRSGLSPETVLPEYETLRTPRLPEPKATLRTAAIWERLSLGLNTFFTVWVRAVSAGTRRTTERRMVEILTRAYPRPPMEPIVLDDDDEASALGRGIASLRYAVRRHDELHDRGVLLPDQRAFELARVFVGSHQPPRARIDEGLHMLRERHRGAKGDDQWIRGRARAEFEVAREAGESWTVPSVVRPHAYRFAAFSQVAADLGGL